MLSPVTHLRLGEALNLKSRDGVLPWGFGKCLVVPPGKASGPLTGSFCTERCHGGGREVRQEEAERTVSPLPEGKVDASFRVGGNIGKEQFGGLSGSSTWVWGCRSRTRKWWVHSQRIWIRPLARKQNCAFDSRGHIKGKSDIKGCFKKSFGRQGTGAEGIQNRNEKLGRPEVLSCGPDSWGGQGQNSQWEAELLFSYFKGRMFTGRLRKGEIRFHCLCDIL